MLDEVVRHEREPDVEADEQEMSEELPAVLLLNSNGRTDQITSSEEPKVEDEPALEKNVIDPPPKSSETLSLALALALRT